MARTYRKSRFGDSRPVRDGRVQYFVRSCRNHGGCPICEANRTFSSRHRAPLDDVKAAQQ